MNVTKFKAMGPQELRALLTEKKAAVEKGTKFTIKGVNCSSALPETKPGQPETNKFNSMQFLLQNMVPTEKKATDSKLLQTMVTMGLEDLSGAPLSGTPEIIAQRGELFLQLLNTLKDYATKESGQAGDPSSSTTGDGSAPSASGDGKAPPAPPPVPPKPKLPPVLPPPQRDPGKAPKQTDPAGSKGPAKAPTADDFNSELLAKFAMRRAVIDTPTPPDTQTPQGVQTPLDPPAPQGPPTPPKTSTPPSSPTPPPSPTRGGGIGYPALQRSDSITDRKTALQRTEGLLKSTKGPQEHKDLCKRLLTQLKLKEGLVSEADNLQNTELKERLTKAYSDARSHTGRKRRETPPITKQDKHKEISPKSTNNEVTKLVSTTPYPKFTCTTLAESLAATPATKCSTIYDPTKKHSHRELAAQTQYMTKQLEQTDIFTFNPGEFNSTSLTNQINYLSDTSTESPFGGYGSPLLNAFNHLSAQTATAITERNDFSGREEQKILHTNQLLNTFFSDKEKTELRPKTSATIMDLLAKRAADLKAEADAQKQRLSTTRLHLLKKTLDIDFAAKARDDGMQRSKAIKHVESKLDPLMQQHSNSTDLKKAKEIVDGIKTDTMKTMTFFNGLLDTSLTDLKDLKALETKEKAARDINEERTQLLETSMKKLSDAMKADKGKAGKKEETLRLAMELYEKVKEKACDKSE